MVRAFFRTLPRANTFALSVQRPSTPGSSGTTNERPRARRAPAATDVSAKEQRLWR